MLRSLHIENVALIKRLDIDFENGFSVLTGETGAGKSILIDSINLICGARASRDIIRSGEEECFVSALFDSLSGECIEILGEQGIETDSDDGSILLSRKFMSDGRSICKINTRTVPVSVLKSASACLVSMSEQHDSYSLLNPELHLDYLDRFANFSNKSFSDTKKKYSHAFALYSEAKNALKSAHIDESERRTKLEFLHYQQKEITSAKIKKGEEENLLSQRNVIRHSEVISKAIRGTAALLMGSSKPGAFDKLIMSSENIEKISDVIPNGNDIVSKLQSLAGEVSAISDELSRLLPRDVDNSTEMLDRIESRLDTIAKIKDKYGETEEDVLHTLENIEKQISFLEEYEFSIKELEEKERETRTVCQKCAQELLEARTKAAKLLSEKINGEFLFLDMKDVLFKVEFEKTDDLGENGDATFEFFVKTNPGEPFKKLVNVASGGELSRMMLALKKTLVGCDCVGTVVFDEIDTGVSGKTSSKIGISIKALSNICQVICVTHSAQVSAIASHHYKISKAEFEGRMFTSVQKLDEEERVLEISRILGGVTVTDHAVETARELISQGLNTNIL